MKSMSIQQSVTLLKDAIDRADTPDGPRPFLFDTLSLRDAKRILDAWADAGLVDGPRGSVLPPPDRARFNVANDLTAQQTRSQYWRVTLDCGHTQEVHSVRDGGPLFVLRCQTCNPGKARRIQNSDREAR